MADPVVPEVPVTQEEERDPYACAICNCHHHTTMTHDAVGANWDEDDGDDYGQDEVVDPCVFCPHDNADHREDGCVLCGCVAAQ